MNVIPYLIILGRNHKRRNRLYILFMGGEEQQSRAIVNLFELSM